MEKMEQQPIEVKKITKVNSFLLAIGLAFLFLIICLPVLKDASNFSYEEKTAIGNINMWRVVVGFGILSVLTSAYLFFKKKGHKFTILFLWIFWLIGFLLTYRMGSFHLNSDSIDTQSLGAVGTMRAIIAFVPTLIWFFGIYYCRRIAINLNMNKAVAVLVGIFIPYVSLLIYFLFSFHKKEKQQKVKLLKIIGGTIVIIALISAGAFYYISGTPEYSLYKLKQAIIKNDINGIEKYFYSGNIAKKNNEIPSQFQKELVSGLNASFWEIKETNSDTSKTAEAYVSTGLTGNKLENASLVFSKNSEPLILLKLNDEGAKLYAEITKRNIGKSLAIFLGGQLVSSTIIQNEVDDGNISFASNYSKETMVAFVDRINQEKTGMINGLGIRDKKIDGNSAKIIIGINSKAGTGGNIELSLVKMPDRSWMVIDFGSVIGLSNEKAPAPEGEKVATFKWKFKGKNYSLDEKLYDSIYKFYGSLSGDAVFNGESAVGWQEKNNDIFLQEFDGDNSLQELAQSLKAIADENNFDQDQLAEFVASFVQTIPYDTEKYNNIKAGINEKVYYPYEVLYNNKGVCSDKSYLTYSLLRNLGYGVAIFLFPEDQHMAMGVKCPIEYSNYDSGYCFLETTSLGNKIGSAPNLSKEFGIATAKVELNDFSMDYTESSYNPLGKIEVLNKIDGNEYTGIIETVATQKKIDNLFYTIRQMDRELDALNQDLNSQKEKIGDMEDKLKKLEKNLTYNNYDDYSSYYSKYKKSYSNLKKDISAFNAKVANRNQLNNQYNSLIRSFYQ